MKRLLLKSWEIADENEVLSLILQERSVFFRESKKGSSYIEYLYKNRIYEVNINDCLFIKDFYSLQSLRSKIVTHCNRWRFISDPSIILSGIRVSVILLSLSIQIKIKKFSNK